MNKIYYLFLLCTLFTLGSCNKDEESDQESDFRNNGDILQFKDQSAFDRYVANGKGISGFTSLYDDYINALSEAEEYYVSEEGYREFKEKYSGLYFPEEGDDYSAYLPVSNEKVAMLLNPDGDVMIGNEVVNLKDIDNYEKLAECRLTPSATIKAKATGSTYSVTVDRGSQRMRIRTWVKDTEYVHVEVAFYKKMGFMFSNVWFAYPVSGSLEPVVIRYKYSHVEIDYSNSPRPQPRQWEYGEFEPYWLYDSNAPWDFSGVSSYSLDIESTRNYAIQAKNDRFIYTDSRFEGVTYAEFICRTSRFGEYTYKVNY